MNSVGAIIFSRMDSKRLPSKALIDIFGRTLLGRVLDRTKGIKNINKIVIATTDRAVDDPIEDFAKAEGINCFRGSLDDVALRAKEASDKFNLSGFVRVCGDRPFFDPLVIDNLIVEYLRNDLDLATTTGRELYPPGLTGEVVSVESLKNIIPKLDAYDKEHLTSFYYRNCDNFRIKYIQAPDYIQANSKIRLVVDDERDLARARWIASHITVMSSSIAYMHEVVLLAKQWDATYAETSF